MSQISEYLFKTLTGLTIAICISGCATTDFAALQEEPGYIAGFSDGCATAQEAEKSFSTERVRDDIAFNDDKSYQAGWRSGLLQCDYRNDDTTSQGGRILGENQNF